MKDVQFYQRKRHGILLTFIYDLTRMNIHHVDADLRVSVV